MWNRRQFVAASAATALAPRAFAQATAPPLRFIDSHVHVWTHDPAFPFAAGAHPAPDSASVETLLDRMKANDVVRTVIIQVIHYKWDNS
jgi:L-fuconolactonase